MLLLCYYCAVNEKVTVIMSDADGPVVCPIEGFLLFEK